MLLFPVSPSYEDALGFSEASPWLTDNLPPLAGSLLGHIFGEVFLSPQAEVCARGQTCCSRLPEQHEEDTPDEDVAPADSGVFPEAPLTSDNNEEPSDEASSAACTSHGEQSSQLEFTRALDLAGFAPDEITVKAVGNRIEVYAGHLEKPSSDGERDFVRREYTHRFTLPDDVRPDSVTSTLTKDGTLVVRAPRNAALSAEGTPQKPSSLAAVTS